MTPRSKGCDPETETISRLDLVHRSVNGHGRPPAAVGEYLPSVDSLVAH
jgi:hypothetical protein